MSSRQESSPFVVQLGITNFDNESSPEATALSYPVTSDPVPPSIVQVVDDDMSESGRFSHYGQETGNVLYTEITYNLQCKGDPVSIGTLAYWASHRSAAATGAAFGTSSVGYKNNWLGGTVTTTTAVQHRSTTAEFLGIPNVDDSHHNLRAYNTIVEECTISGQRGGRVDVSASLRGGGNYAYISGAATGRGRTEVAAGLTGPLMFSSDCWLLTNDNTGLRATPVGAARFNADPDDYATNVIAASALDAATSTPDLDLMDDWIGFSLTFRKPVDVQQSLTPGGNAYVQHYDDWFVGQESCVLTLSFIDNSTAVKTLKSEYEARTVRPFEVYMQSATNLGEDDAYPGFTFAAPKMRPVPGSYRKSASIDGPVMVSIDYVPLYDTSESCAFLCGFSADASVLSTAIGSS